MAICNYCEAYFCNDSVLSQHIVYILSGLVQSEFCMLIYYTHLFEEWIIC